jgi:hypothetical protein
LSGKGYISKGLTRGRGREQSKTNSSSMCLRDNGDDLDEQGVRGIFRGPNRNREADMKAFDLGEKNTSIGDHRDVVS